MNGGLYLLLVDSALAEASRERPVPPNVCMFFFFQLLPMLEVEPLILSTFSSSLVTMLHGCKIVWNCWDSDYWLMNQMNRKDGFLRWCKQPGRLEISKNMGSIQIKINLREIQVNYKLTFFFFLCYLFNNLTPILLTKEEDAFPFQCWIQENWSVAV